MELHDLFGDVTYLTDSKDSDVVFTPQWIFDRLGLEFDLDPAHPPHPTYVPTKHYYTEKDDGLAQEWFGLVWLNPPYSKPEEWVRRWLEHGNGFLLVPFSKSKWCYDLFQSEARLWFINIAGNPNFVFEKNGQKHGIFMPTALWAIGDVAVRALENMDGKVR